MRGSWNILGILALSLLLTLSFELAFALFWSIRQKALRGGRELLLVVLVNCLTNPVVVLLYYTALAYLPWLARALIPVLEICAVLVEWLCYRACSQSLRHPFLFALTANAFSYGMGCLICSLW